MPASPTPHHIALAGGAVLATCIGWHKIVLTATVAKYSFMVYLIDKLPQSTRRKILSKEYSGEDLERRLTITIFKGFSTVKALWRMASINLQPQTRVGERIPATPVLSLETGQQLMLGDLARSERPLVVNFGSCS